MATQRYNATISATWPRAHARNSWQYYSIVVWYHSSSTQSRSNSQIVLKNQDQLTFVRPSVLWKDNGYFERKIFISGTFVTNLPPSDKPGHSQNPKQRKRAIEYHGIRTIGCSKDQGEETKWNTVCENESLILISQTGEWSGRAVLWHQIQLPLK